MDRRKIQATSDHKLCIRCGDEKPHAEFNKCSGNVDGRQAYCIPCQRLVAIEWRSKNPERVKSNNARTNPIYNTPESKRLAYHKSNYGDLTPILEMTKDRFRVARSLGFRSSLEVHIAKQLDYSNVPYEYESKTLRYIKPEEICRYTPDFILPNYIVIEGKGQFTSDDRKKTLLVLSQNPGVDLRFVFSNSRNRIGKRSQTTYAKWCERNGIKYADKKIPEDWLKEPVNLTSAAAIEKAFTCR